MVKSNRIAHRQNSKEKSNTILFPVPTRFDFFTHLLFYIFHGKIKALGRCTDSVVWSREVVWAHNETFEA